MGPTLATEVILNSSLRDEFTLIHLDTSDHRDLGTLGALDLRNVYLALKAYVVMFWLLLRHWPDLVYIPISQTTIGYLKDSGLILIAKLFGRRVVCHLRGGNFSNWLRSASAATRWYVRTVHGTVNGQIVLGETLRTLFAGILPDARIHVVPNGKDVAYGARPPRDATVRLLYLANMVRSKGVLDVLHAVPLVLQTRADVEFIFCGAWEDPAVRRAVEAFISANPGLPIRWLGPVSGRQKSDVINSADVFVFPTYYPPEGHPWVIVEAMAAGLPIISTDQGAITESVIEGQNGYIVDKENPAMLAERIVTLVGNAALRDSMGRASRLLYEAGFTEKRMVERLAGVFRSVLASRGPVKS